MLWYLGYIQYLSKHLCSILYVPALFTSMSTPWGYSEWICVHIASISDNLDRFPAT